MIINEGIQDHGFIDNRTEGYDDWKETVSKYTPDYVESLTGVDADDIVQAARIYAKPPFSGSCLIWGMGITQHTMGTANAHGLLNLAFVSGQLGKPGSGVSPLRGQNKYRGVVTLDVCRMLFLVIKLFQRVRWKSFQMPGAVIFFRLNRG